MTVMQVYPIGIVRTEGMPKDTAQIEIYDRFSAGLRGVENADSLWVLFWMHKLSEDSRKTLLVHPRGDTKRVKQGVFALRSPMRPNPIGLTRVKLVERRGDILIVNGMDALNGTPVLDIKRA
jgi:tRNA-Thr(GGU) m(6)t(6)A37 methyltransferase TsaA